MDVPMRAGCDRCRDAAVLVRTELDQLIARALRPVATGAFVFIATSSRRERLTIRGYGTARGCARNAPDGRGVDRMGSRSCAPAATGRRRVSPQREVEDQRNGDNDRGHDPDEGRDAADGRKRRVPGAPARDLAPAFRGASVDIAHGDVL